MVKTDKLRNILHIRGVMRQETVGTKYSPQVEWYAQGSIYKLKILLAGKVVAESILDPKEPWEGTETAIGIKTRAMLGGLA